MINIQKKRLLNFIGLPIFLGLSCSLQGVQTQRKASDTRTPLNGMLFTVNVGLTIISLTAGLKYAQNNPNSSTTRRAIAFLPTILFYSLVAKDVFQKTN